MVRQTNSGVAFTASGSFSYTAWEVKQLDEIASQICTHTYKIDDQSQYGVLFSDQ